MISLNDVSVRRGKRYILKNIDFRLTPGKITAIVGPNGSGKSTLLKVMSNAIKADRGTATLDDKTLQAWPKKQLAQALAYLPQSSELPNGMTVEEVVGCGRFAHLTPWARLGTDDKAIIEQAMADTEVLHHANAKVDNLSGGEMQRVWLATVLAQGSDLLLLDEPSSFLDLSHQLELMGLIHRLNRRHGKTIALVIHDLNQAIQWCDEVVVMQQGKIQSAGDIQKLQDPAILKSVFKLSARFISLPGTNKPLLHADVLTSPEATE